MTCMDFCTHITPCQTLGQSQSPFPTEVTCAPICHASPGPFCGPQVTVGACVPGGQPGQAAMAARCLGFTAVGTVPMVCTAACSIVYPTQQGWVCGSHHTPCCPVPVHTFAGATCAFICGSQQTPCCPIPPPGSPACPPGSLACGPGEPGPVDQAALGMARVATAWCSWACSPVVPYALVSCAIHPPIRARRTALNDLTAWP